MLTNVQDLLAASDLQALGGNGVCFAGFIQAVEHSANMEMMEGFLSQDGRHSASVSGNNIISISNLNCLDGLSKLHF